LLSIPLNSQVCELGEINFESQAQVDSFASKYPNCRQFSGTLRINSSTITNVDSFYHVQSLNGSILFYSDELNDISGLKNLKRITGLYFLNGKLTNLDPLENLEVCEFDLVLSSPLLNDVSGLINLRYAAYLWIESPSFISLEWINDIDTVYNYIFSDFILLRECVICSI
jgi:hypothetical protein